MNGCVFESKSWHTSILGNIVLSMGSGTTPKADKLDFYENGTINWLVTGDLNDSVIKKTSNKITQDAYDKSSLKVYQPGNIIIAMYGATIGKLGILEIETTTNQACCSIQCGKKLYPKFLFYFLLNERPFIVSRALGGGQPNISQSTVKNLFIHYPPYDLQIAIASYLDEKCGKIDAIVATLRQLADKYTSLKRSLINETVCRGLDKNVTLKPSGIDWIGDIPEHWTVERLSNCIRETSTGFWGEEEKNNEFDRVCLRIADFDYEHGNISLKKLTYRNIDEEHYNCRRLEKGDLLIEKSGGGDIWPVGRTVRFLLDIEATFTNFIMQIKINDKNNSNYIYYYLHFVYSLGISRMYFDQTIGIQNLDVIGYLRQVMCLPPKSEQQAIATYLDEKCGKIDAIVDNINAQIESYKKLKKSLINDVVTGKRRVI